MGSSITKLIEQGKEIEQGLHYVQPLYSTIRTYKQYELSNLEYYYSWSSQCCFFLDATYPKSPCIQQFNEAKEEFEKPSNHFYPKYLNKMLGILEACKEVFESPSNTDNKQASVIKTKKKSILFISHASKDEKFVKDFVSLLQTIGFDKNNLFCSSIDGFGIEEGKDI